MERNYYGKRLTFDVWRGATFDRVTLEQPTERQVADAIDRLDGDTTTLVVIGGEGESHLAVGGGGCQFVVYATFDNVTYSSLLRPDADDGMITLVAGGQAGDYSSQQVVDKEAALRAALRFLVEGRLGRDLGWDE